MVGLSRLQAVCCVGHSLVFLSLLCVGVAPYWVTYHQSQRHSDSQLGLLFTCESRTLRSHQSYYCRLLEWDDYHGSLPAWLNVIRVLVAVSAYLVLLALLADVKSCCCQTSSSFFTQAVLLFHAAALLITSVVIFARNEADLNGMFNKTLEGQGNHSTGWVYHLACVAAGLNTLVAIVSLFARRTRPLPLAKYPAYRSYNTMTGSVH